MISAVSSASAALQVLEAGAPLQAASWQQGQDTTQRFVDPRSTLALPPQTFDRLLNVKIELQLKQARGPQVRQSVPVLSGVGTTEGPSKLGWLNSLHETKISHVTSWLIEMEKLYHRTLLPTNSPLLPWNSPDVLQQLMDADEHEDHAEMRERAIRASDALVYASMAQTPPEDVAEIKSLGGEIWYDCVPTYDHIEDKELVRNIRNSCLYGSDLASPIDLSNRVAQAFLNGTARILRSSDFPDLQVKSREYSIYALAPQIGRYKWIAGFGKTDYNARYLEEIQKKIPDMELQITFGAPDEMICVFIPKATPATPASGRRDALN